MRILVFLICTLIMAAGLLWLGHALATTEDTMNQSSTGLLLHFAQLWIASLLGATLGLVLLYPSHQTLSHGGAPRQPRKRASRQQERTSEPSGHQEYGEIVRYFDDKRYGFIRAEDGDEIFYHRSNIIGQRPQEGARISFIRVDTDRGPRAEEVEEESR